MILLIDNYDSFTYNLEQYIGSLGKKIRVVRNDEIDVSEVLRISPEGIVISPGPGRPESAGCSMDVIRSCTGKIPILGVCLGHQCIARVFGAEITGAKRLMHGKTSSIHHDQNSIYTDLPTPVSATRYHSLIVDADTVSAPLVQTAETSRGELMGLRHAKAPVEGIQFHPESIMTEHGLRMVENFCAQCNSPVNPSTLTLPSS